MDVVADSAPSSNELTDYDRDHLGLYLRLLDAKAAGAGLDEMARIVLKLDPVREPARARAIVTSHLERAEWMTRRGYRLLLRD